MDGRADLAQSLLGELARRGLGQQEIARRTGVQQVDPHQMSPQELAALAQWMQQQHPQAFGRVAAQHQREPDILAGLLGKGACGRCWVALAAKLATSPRAWLCRK